MLQRLSIEVREGETAQHKNGAINHVPSKFSESYPAPSLVHEEAVTLRRDRSWRVKVGPSLRLMTLSEARAPDVSYALRDHEGYVIVTLT